MKGYRSDTRGKTDGMKIIKRWIKPCHQRPGSRGGSEGSVLVVSFFVLALLAMFMTTVGYVARQRFQMVSRLDTRQKLRYIGDSGVQKAIHVFVMHRERHPTYDSLNQSWSRNEPEFKDVKVGDGFFSVYRSEDFPLDAESSGEEPPAQGLVDEESKININAVRLTDILRRLFREATGLSDGEVAAWVDALEDWIDEDNDTRSLGAEDRYYRGLNPPYLPRNGVLATLSELQWIKGITPEIYRKMKPYITLHSSGRVNLNTASEPVLSALGFIPSLVSKIKNYRSGRDGLIGTEDDQSFDNVSTAAQQLAKEGYLSDNERANFDAVIQSGFLSVKSQFFTAQVLARLEHKKQAMRVVATFDERGMIKRWEETFVGS